MPKIIQQAQKSPPIAAESAVWSLPATAAAPRSRYRVRLHPRSAHTAAHHPAATHKPLSMSVLFQVVSYPNYTMPTRQLEQESVV